MKNASRINGGNSEYGRVESDFYPTPPEVTQALINFLQIPKYSVIWEPACGEGHMAETFISNGYNVIATDLHDRGYGIGGIDFLSIPIQQKYDWIITNPPFSLSANFIEQCINIGVPFALLLKTQYWNAKKRYNLFMEHKPSYILPLTWRPDFLFKKRGKGSPLMDCMWCVWNGYSANSIYIPLLKPQDMENK